MVDVELEFRPDFGPIYFEQLNINNRFKLLISFDVKTFNSMYYNNILPKISDLCALKLAFVHS